MDRHQRTRVDGLTLAEQVRVDLSLRLSAKSRSAQCHLAYPTRHRDVLGIQPLQRLALPRPVHHSDTHVAGAVDDATQWDGQRGSHHRVGFSDRELGQHGGINHTQRHPRTYLDTLPRRRLPDLYLDLFNL